MMGTYIWVDHNLKAVAILLSGTDSKGGCLVETIKADSSSLPCQRQQALMVESYLDNTFCRDRGVLKIEFYFWGGCFSMSLATFHFLCF